MLARRLVLLALLVLPTFAPHAAWAQLDTRLDEASLRAPWELHLAIMRGLAGDMRTGDVPSGRIDRLTLLQVALGEYEGQVDQLIDRIAYDTQFGFVAADTSAALANQLEDIEHALDAVYESFGCRDREDVRRAQSALHALRAMLALRSPFEGEVVNALGSGFRQARVDLATRWWKGEEQAIELHKVVAALRERLELGAPSGPK